jgi:CRISPR/Cas system-associated protein Cas10 (large subunit of type III CRISPR-Cas system)
MKNTLINQRKFLFAYIRLEDLLCEELTKQDSAEFSKKELKKKYRSQILKNNISHFDLEFPKGTIVENIESSIRKEISRLSD